MGGIHQENLNAFMASQARMNVDFLPTEVPDRDIVTLFTDPGLKIPSFLRTGPKGCGSPNHRKKFRSITVFGRGTVAIRAYVDGRMVINEALATASGIEHGQRKVNFPRGTCGYVVDIELAGDFDYRMIGVDYDKA